MTDLPASFSSFDAAGNNADNDGARSLGLMLISDGLGNVPLDNLAPAFFMTAAFLAYIAFMGTMLVLKRELFSNGTEDAITKLNHAASQGPQTLAHWPTPPSSHRNLIDVCT